MCSLRVDVAGIDGGGSRVSAAGSLPRALSGQAGPVAADPVSVSVAATLGARAAAISGHSTLAAAISAHRGAQLHTDAAHYTATEAANAALLAARILGARVPHLAAALDDYAAAAEAEVAAKAAALEAQGWQAYAAAMKPAH